MLQAVMIKRLALRVSSKLLEIPTYTGEAQLFREWICILQRAVALMKVALFLGVGLHVISSSLTAAVIDCI